METILIEKCPFCRRIPRIKNYEDVSESISWIQCDCGARGPRYYSIPDRCVIEDWNRVADSVDHSNLAYKIIYGE